MSKIVWDADGQRFFETGIDHGVLYVRNDTDNTYTNGVAWNGIVSVQESPSGAEPSPIFADNIKYVNLMSEEEFGGTIEAYTYPEEFSECDGTKAFEIDGAKTGIMVSQQSRKTFGLAYRSRIGDDIVQDSLGYKLHLVWGALAQPSEKQYQTVNQSPEANTFSWTFTTTKIPFDSSGDFSSFKPTSHMVIDSRHTKKEVMVAINEKLFGENPELPSPDELLKLVKSTGEVVSEED